MASFGARGSGLTQRALRGYGGTLMSFRFDLARARVGFVFVFEEGPGLDRKLCDVLIGGLLQEWGALLL